LHVTKFKRSEKNREISFFLVHFPVFTEDSNPISTKTPSEKPSRTSSNSPTKASAGTIQRSRWRKSKPWTQSSTIKRKYPKSNVRHGEAKWYLETISSINTTNDVNNNNEETDNTTLSSPTMDQPNQKLGK
jgi:hypothetical protein